MKLDPIQADTLRIGIYVSQTIGKLQRHHLATGYGISYATLRRYYFPQSRSISRVVALRYFRSGSKPVLGFHPRCTDCGKLVDFGTRCPNCFDYARGRTLSLDPEAAEAFVNHLFP
jgi:hypothetical protein